MAMTLAGFVATRLAIETFAHPSYQPPMRATWDFLAQARPNGPTDWVVEQGWIDATGQRLSNQQVYGVCATHRTTPDVVAQCIHTHGWLSYVIYQPADRFWLFQGIESMISFGLTLALLGLAFWWVRTRLT
jgi:hypothetical protein